MFKIVICDDDISFILYMEKMLINCGLSTREVEFYRVNSGEKCIEIVNQLVTCDLLILDMQMGGMDGHKTAEIFRKIYPDSLLIFCSGVVQPTDESFKTTPFRYLKKTYSDEKMKMELKVIIDKMIEQKKVPSIVGKYHLNAIKLRPKDILFIENYKRGSSIRIINDIMDYSFEEKITTKMKLDEIYGILKDFDFVYAHNSYIVNLQYVIKFKSDGVIKLIDGTELNVSRSKMPEFRRALSRVMSDKYY